MHTLLALLLACTPDKSPLQEEETGSTETADPDTSEPDTADPDSGDSADTSETGETGDPDEAPATACDPAEPLTSFVTRDGDQLLLDGAPFRFVSVNLPDLLGIVDPAWTIPTPWEQRDGLCAVRQMGGQVARTYTISVGDSGTDVPRHVLAPGELSEEQMVAMDHAIAAANEQGVRLIVPLVDQWSWVGGIAEHAEFRGKSADEFWTDEELIADFELVVEAVLTRTNTVTGVPYAEDPAILAWETGNELDAPPAWTARVAALIRALAPQQLVLDGTFGVEPANLDNPDIDIVSNHYYWPAGFADDYAAAAAADRAASEGSRPFLVGEFGLVPTWRVLGLLDEVVANGSTGVLAWSLRFRDAEGGFYWHTEYDDGTTKYAAYHWPGFDSGEAWDETEVLSALTEAAWEIRGEAAPTPLPPEAPEILSLDLAGTLRWRGSAGASAYVLEQAEAADGPWVEVARDFHDAEQPNTAEIAVDRDTAASALYYRLSALGAGGLSEPSTVWGPVTQGSSFVDPLDDLSLTAEATESLVIDGANSSLFDGDTGRVCRTEPSAATLVWSPGAPILALELDAYAWPWEDTPTLTLEVSADGATWEPLEVEITDLGGDWNQFLYGADVLPEGATWLRVTIPEHGGQNWNPQVAELRLLLGDG